MAPLKLFSRTHYNFGETQRSCGEVPETDKKLVLWQGRREQRELKIEAVGHKSLFTTWTPQ